MISLRGKVPSPFDITTTVIELCPNPVVRFGGVVLVLRLIRSRLDEPRLTTPCFSTFITDWLSGSVCASTSVFSRTPIV